MNNLDELLDRIKSEYDALSPRLKQVANFMIDNPQSIAFDTLATIAGTIGTHASTLVRFANYFGYSGFSEVQQLFKDRQLSQSVDYRDRIRRLQTEIGDNTEVTPPQLLKEFTEANLLSLEHLRNHINDEDLEQAVDMMDKTSSIYICGIRRAFPVSMYLTYALNHIEVRCQAIDGLGNMQLEQTRCMTRDDLMIAITFRPYAQATRDVVKIAHERGAKIILITDSELSPLEKYADLTFSVRDAEVRSFRSLNSTMCLAQTLSIALGFRRESRKAQAS